MVGEGPTVCVLGLGGIGGVLAASLVEGGACSAVVLAARGRAAASLKAAGLRVRTHEGADFVVEPCDGTAGAFTVDTEDPNELRAVGPVDVLFVTTKSQQLPAAAAAAEKAGLVDSETVVVPVINGWPFWWARPGTPKLAAPDPDGAASAAFPHPENVLGCVCFVSGSVEAGADGALTWYSRWPSDRNTLLLGPVAKDGAAERAMNTVGKLFARDGKKVSVWASVVPDIHETVFDKLLVNASLNTIAALTRSDCGQIADSERTRGILRAVVAEVSALAEKLGVRLSMSADDIVLKYSGQRGLKPSMLQDVEAGRALETGTIVHALVELGSRLGSPTPTLDVLGRLLDALESNVCACQGGAS